MSLQMQPTSCATCKLHEIALLIDNITVSSCYSTQYEKGLCQVKQGRSSGKPKEKQRAPSLQKGKMTCFEFKASRFPDSPTKKPEWFQACYFSVKCSLLNFVAIIDGTSRPRFAVASVERLAKGLSHRKKNRPEGHAWLLFVRSHCR